VGLPEQTRAKLIRGLASVIPARGKCVEQHMDWLRERGRDLERERERERERIQQREHITRAFLRRGRDRVTVLDGLHRTFHERQMCREHVSAGSRGAGRVFEKIFSRDAVDRYLETPLLPLGNREPPTSRADYVRNVAR